MVYSTEPRDICKIIYVKGYGFLSFAKNMGKSADKITSVSKKKSTTELHSKGLHNNNDEDAEITSHKKRYISPKERQQIINELGLVPKKDAYF